MMPLAVLKKIRLAASKNVGGKPGEELHRSLVSYWR
jgi:hypothetical protein